MPFWKTEIKNNLNYIEDLMKKYLLLSFIIIVSNLLAQMPPHPDLLEKIKNGEIEEPYALKNIVQLKERGVSTGWTSEELTKQNSLMNKNDVHRTYGPAKAVSDSFKAIFLFVEFSDQADQVSISFFDDLLYANNESSVRGYYDQISYGNLDLTTDDMPSTIGWVTAPQSYAYYVGGSNGFDGTFPRNAAGLARDIVQLVDPVINFAPYDNDGDGEIDALFIVHTGPGAEFSGSDDDIWSHAWGIPGGYMTDDGVEATGYSMEPEYWQTPGDMTIGVYAHEMGHSVFGLPDVYDTDYTSSGVGDWSLMAGGSWNGNLGNSPAWPDAWNHIQMGYVTPTVVSADMLNETITAMTTMPDVYKIWKDGNPGSQYFLVQNRQKVNYDADLPKGGLLIWHIDETQDGNSNEWYPGHTNSGNYLVALEQADGNYDLEKDVNGGDAKDPFPGNTNNTQFNFLSEPGSDAYNGTTTYVSVENISASSNNMTADIKISQPAEFLQVTAPNGGESWAGSSSKTIKWASNGITNISLELSIDGGSNWTDIETTYDASTEQYSWLVPNTPSTNCLVRVTDLDNNANVDESNSAFTITAAPEIKVVSPNGGEEFDPADKVEITWSSSSVSSVRIQYSIDNGSNWLAVAPITPSDGIYNWTVPNNPSTECLIKVTDISNGNILDESDSVFTINSNGLAAPQLVMPSDDEINLGVDVDFEWDAVLNAEGYTINVADDSAFANLVYQESSLTGTTITIEHFLEGTKYYWKVLAEGTAEIGPFSSTFSFTTMLNAPDSLTAEVYSHTPDQVILNWADHSDNEDGYKVERMDAGLTWTEVDEVGANQTTWSETIANPMNYSYRVRAYTQDAESEYSNEASVLVSSISDNEAVPTVYTLEQNYPNPFNPSTQIRFGLPFDSNVKLKIYNILGQTVTELVNETLISGYHTLEWNASTLTSGIYFYSIEANSVNGNKSFSSVKKMLLVK